MSDYEPTREQEKAIREYLHESIVPLIEQVLVKKLGQAMSYAAQELINPKREWVSLTDEEAIDISEQCQWYDGDCERFDSVEFARAIEAKLREKNGGKA